MFRSADNPKYIILNHLRKCNHIIPVFLTNYVHGLTDSCSKLHLWTELNWIAAVPRSRLANPDDSFHCQGLLTVKNTGLVLKLRANSLTVIGHLQYCSRQSKQCSRYPVLNYLIFPHFTGVDSALPQTWRLTTSMSNLSPLSKHTFTERYFHTHTLKPGAGFCHLFCWDFLIFNVPVFDSLFSPFIFIMFILVFWTFILFNLL